MLKLVSQRTQLLLLFSSPRFISLEGSLQILETKSNLNQVFLKRTEMEVFWGAIKRKGLNIYMSDNMEQNMFIFMVKWSSMLHSFYILRGKNFISGLSA